MAYKNALEALNRTLCDIRNDNRIMGGITVLLPGDFRQTLPVVPKGTRADQINCCIQKSTLWPVIKKITLKQNMRVHLGIGSDIQEFSNFLLSIGEETLPDIDDQINLPPMFKVVLQNINELI